MSIEVYEQLKGKLELYHLLEQGLEDERIGKTRPFLSALADIRKAVSG